MGLNTNGLKGLDQNASFARRAEMADGDFSSLEEAQKYITLIGTFPFVGYFLVLKKCYSGITLHVKYTQYHSPRHIEVLGKPVLSQKTTQIQLNPLLDYGL